ncbi:MAG: carboxylate-amine ligase [Hyphomicrobiaceae bacterium]|nr:carboxylate-amine ligase [Hyphomicrobiaceae bacterium]
MTLVRPETAGGGHADVSARFAAMQERFKTAFSAIFDDPLAKRTVLIVPSLTVDADVMAKIAGVYRYEERMLCLLLLLRMPQTNVIYVTSSPICETIVDYYLHLLPGIPSGHARKRLTLLACEDAAPVALSRKILDRPRLIERIKAAIPDTGSAHMTCFTVTELERELALQLDLPVYGCDPDLLYWGTKSGSRRVFREAGIPMAPGYEDLSTPDDVARALAELKKQCPDLDKAVVKINEGFSGEGNAVISLKGAPQGSALLDWVRGRLSQMAFEGGGMTWELYQSKLKAMGAIVEAFIPGEVKESPSVQFRVDPLGRLEAISTHDQVLGGTNQQIFLGCRFPARADYRLELQELATSAAKVLASKGVLGRFGLDFISVKEGDAWKHYAIEINLRKGGTTHPFLMLQFLTDGRYDAQSGEFLTPSGRPRCYFASDNLESERYRGLCSDDLIDIAVKNGLHFHAATGEGVAFHLIGALSQFGKLGVVCIGETQERADALYRKTVAVLDAEGGADAAKR